MPSADTTEDSTNSGGSLGHLVYMTNHENIEYPDLESKVKWNFTDLASWEPTTKKLGFNQAITALKTGGAVKDVLKDKSLASFGANAKYFKHIPEVASCLGKGLFAGSHDSLWYRRLRYQPPQLSRFHLTMVTPATQEVHYVLHHRPV